MQNNEFQKLNGFIAKLTLAATKGMKRKNNFKNLSVQSSAEMKENSHALAGFDNGLNQIKGIN